MFPMILIIVCVCLFGLGLAFQNNRDWEMPAVIMAIMSAIIFGAHLLIWPAAYTASVDSAAEIQAFYDYYKANETQIQKDAAELGDSIFEKEGRASFLYWASIYNRALAVKMARDDSIFGWYVHVPENFTAQPIPVALMPIDRDADRD